MGQDKKQLEHLLSFVSAVYNDPDNKEFAAGIQAMIKKDLQGDKASWSGKIDEIYEYCLKKNLHEQAEDLYKDFPLVSIRTTLIEDYVRMEEARRRNDFDEFGLHLYQQIEAIVNTLSKDEGLSAIVGKMMLQPACIRTFEFVEGENGKKEKRNYTSEELTPTKRVGKLTVAEMVLIMGEDQERNAAKIQKTLSQHSALDKLYLILYFVCFHAMIYDTVWESWKTNRSLFSTIYNVRNHVHREGNSSEKQKEAYDAAVSRKSQSYLSFLSALVFLVDRVEKGFPVSKELADYADSLE